jgi:hypothetical protein
MSGSNSPSAAECRHLPSFIAGVAVRLEDGSFIARARLTF